jgi:Flp pilus assembly pilin Flp
VRDQLTTRGKTMAAIGLFTRPSRSPLSSRLPSWPPQMIDLLNKFARNDQGQDLIEYTMLLAFVALASAALFINAGSSVNVVWKDANGVMNNAAKCAVS